MAWLGDSGKGLGLGSDFGAGAIGARVVLAALPFGLTVDFFSVFAGALGRCFAVGTQLAQSQLLRCFGFLKLEDSHAFI